MRYVLILIIGAASAVALGFIGLAHFWHRAAVYVCLVLLLPATVIVLLTAAPRPWSRLSRTLLAAFAVTAVFAPASLSFGRFCYDAGLLSAQRFCESHIPSLRRARVLTGRYPASLPITYADLPWFLRRGAPWFTPGSTPVHIYYASDDGQFFSFSFADPNSTIYSWCYRSDRPGWSYDS